MDRSMLHAGLPMYHLGSRLSAGRVLELSGVRLSPAYSFTTN